MDFTFDTNTHTHRASIDVPRPPRTRKKSTYKSSDLGFMYWFHFKRFHFSKMGNAETFLHSKLFIMSTAPIFFKCYVFFSLSSSWHWAFEITSKHFSSIWKKKKIMKWFVDSWYSQWISTVSCQFIKKRSTHTHTEQPKTHGIYFHSVSDLWFMLCRTCICIAWVIREIITRSTGILKNYKAC